MQQHDARNVAGPSHLADRPGMQDVPHTDTASVSDAPGDPPVMAEKFESAASSAPPDHKSVVRSILGARAARDRVLPATWFSDPAWDLLLHLYEARLSSLERTVGDLSSIAGTAPATTNRWLDVLDAEGWLQRRRSDRDQRRVLVSLSAAGAQRMQACFELIDAR